MPVQAGAEFSRQQGAAFRIMDLADGAVVAQRAFQAELGQRVLGAQPARRPIELRVGAGQRADDAPAQAGRYHLADRFRDGVEAVAAVAAEHLVAAVAGKRHGGVAAGQRADRERRHRGMVAERLAEHFRLVAGGADVVGGPGFSLVQAAVAGGDLGGERAFVGRALEADGEGGQRPLPRLAPRRGGECDDGATVHPAGQEGAQRHIRHQPRADGSGEAGGQLGHGFGGRGGHAGGRLPVAAGLRAGLLAPCQQQVVGGRQAVDGGMDGGGVGHVAEGQVVIDRGGVQRAGDFGQGEQGGLFAGEGQRAVRQPGGQQRLFAHAVARQQQRALGAVPQPDGEHAVQPVEHADAPLPPAMDDRLRVGPGAEDVAVRLELRTQGGVVVDFAVERHHHLAVRAEHGLRAPGQVDNGQPPVAEAQMRLGMKAVAVRAAMRDRVGHAAEAPLLGGARVDGVEQADNTAHEAWLLPCRLRGARSPSGPHRASREAIAAIP